MEIVQLIPSVNTLGELSRSWNVNMLTFLIFSYKFNAISIQTPKGFWLVVSCKQKVVWDFSEGSLKGINSSGSCIPFAISLSYYLESGHDGWSSSNYVGPLRLP